MIRLYISFLLMFIFTGYSFSADWEYLCKQGYGVLDQTSVKGEFKGCDYGKVIPLNNGYSFKCGEYNYNYSYSPEVYILAHIMTGDHKVIIDSVKYDGQVIKLP